MKPLFSLLLSLIIAIGGYAQIPVFDWIHNDVSGNIYNSLFFVEVDENGDIYALYRTGNHYFLNGIEYTQPESCLASDCFNSLLVKHNTEGDILWTRPIWYNYRAVPKALRVAPNGDVVVALDYYTSPTFNHPRGLILKIAPDGTTIDSTNVVEGFSLDDMDTDTAGNVFVVGSLNGGPYAIADTTITTGIFLVKYDTNLSALWVRCMSSNQSGLGTVKVKS